MSKYGYMVDTRDEKYPGLFRYKSGEVEMFSPLVQGEWVRTPGRDSVLFGEGDFVWFDDIPEEDVPKYMEIIRRNVAKRTE